jgi:uncharacterized phiE125 gp8 family phage protein
MLTIVNAADSPDLATLAVVKAALGITGTEEDLALRPLITNASVAIATACNRTLVAETVEQTFRSSGGRRGLMLARYPVASITSIMEGGLTLTADDYELDTDSGLVERLSGDRHSCWSSGTITVTYVAGYDIDEVPADFVQAVVTLIAQYRSQAGRDPLLRAVDVVDIERLEYFPTTAAGLPAPVLALIEPHRKPAGC